MKIEPTRYEIEHNGYTTVASFHNNSWTITCRPSDAPAIPPYTNILTVDGWKPVIKNESESRIFESIGDVCHFIKEYS